MKITVTQRDIDLARKRLADKGNEDICLNCPVALAIKGKTHKNVSAGEKTVRLYKTGGASKVYRLPAVATKFIQSFDNGKAVKPISFEITRL